VTGRYSIVYLVIGMIAGCSDRSATLAKTQDASNTIQDASSIVQEPLQEPTEFAPGCVHPAVTQICADGWCRIPEGCFIQGSPEDEPDRAMYGEQQTAVTLTRPFLIQQHEVTQREWVDFSGGKTGITLDPDSGVSLDNCLEDDCPADAVNMVEAMAYANFLSVNNNPPLAPCFKLVDCSGPVSNRPSLSARQQPRWGANGLCRLLGGRGFDLRL
jgi:formylglycine-generating enzyme required for sulfatase activity